MPPRVAHVLVPTRRLKTRWRWIVAAVAKGNETVFLDPAKCSKGREVRVTAAAAIGNLLKWMDGDV